MSSSKSASGGLLLPTLVVLVAVGALAWVVAASMGGSDSAATVQQEAKNPNDQAKVDIEPRREAGDPLAIGDVDAPVVLIEYSDFQCPFCGKFARDAQPELIEKYVDDGTLRIEWRDFPYMGDDSKLAARAGRAAAGQDKFWEFHDALYADQPKTNSGKMTENFLAGIAKEAGLKVSTFKSDLASDKFNDDIGSDFKQGQSFGVSAAPTFFINGTPIVGAQPMAAFTDVIEHEADQAK